MDKKTRKNSGDKKAILITGDRGFISGYVIPKLLDMGHVVIGVDNNWKYGPTKKSFDRHPQYYHYRHDAKDTKFLYSLMEKYKVDYVIQGAAMIGGIPFFHRLAYDLLAENERLSASAFDAAIKWHRKRKLKKIVVISSSMVFENVENFPSKEGDQLKCPPPSSTYGFQKLATEYFAKGANIQYGVPYMIVRPFNCAGIGEEKAKVDVEIKSGNISLAMSHVIPDLIQKIYKGQYPLRILGSGKQIRHYTYGGDLADGILAATFSDFINEDFNLSTQIGHTVLDLAKIIWAKMNPNKPFKWISDQPFKYDVQKRIPDTKKAEKMLGFKAKTSLDKILNETIPWVCKMVDKGRI
jgi:UDP-glucose 4-epimerase